MNGITVICPNSRRCLVKVTPSTQLRKVLEEACLKQGFDIAAHELKHQNHTLDLALPLRLTGLPNNATVEMVPSTHGSIPVQIQIALQLGDGSRLVRKFSNKMNLLDVLHEFSQEAGCNLVKCNDGQVPSCAYMNKEYRGEAELKLTTLEAMGITGGRCLIRYSAVTMSADELSKHESRLAEENVRKKKLEEGYETRKVENERRLQLEAEREKVFKRELEAKREAGAARAQERSQDIAMEIESALSSISVVEAISRNMPEPIAQIGVQLPAPSRLHQLQSILNQVNTSLDTNAADFLGERLVAEDGRIHISDLHTSRSPGNEGNVSTTVSSSNQTSSPKVPEQPTAIEKCNRMPIIIRRDSKSGDEQESVREERDDIDDQFFQLTVNDVKSIQRDLKAQAGLEEQRALIPKAYVLEKNKQLKEESYKHTVVRFNFADKTVLQAQFISKEPVSRLFEFIGENLKTQGTKFDLCLVNQRLPSTDAKNLIDVGVAPKSSLYIRIHSPEKTFAAHFVRDNFCEIPMSEADELSKEWLSVNGIYQPYQPKVLNASDVRPNGKRQSKAAEDDGEPSKIRQQHSKDVPKWFKKQ